MENKTGKYLKYAIGEIVLVVIGILIALQVNNWNEKKIEDQKLQTIYNIILKDLEGDLIKIKNTLNFHNKREPYFNHVLEGKLTTNDYADSTYLSLITYAEQISLTTRGINLLTSSTYDNAVANSLQINLTEFYTLYKGRFEFLENYIITDIEDNFSHWKNNYEWYPDYILRKNLDEFISYTINNPDYKNRVVNYYFVHYQVAIGYLEEFLENANYAIKQIKNNYD